MACRRSSSSRAEPPAEPKRFAATEKPHAAGSMYVVHAKTQRTGRHFSCQGKCGSMETLAMDHGKRPHANSQEPDESRPFQRRRCDDLKSWKDIPDSFTDIELTFALNGENCFPNYRKFPLVCGLIIKLRSGYLRVYGRSNNRFPRLPSEQHPQQFYDLVGMFCYETTKLQDEWTADSLWATSEVITVKSINVDVTLQREIYLHPLYPLDPVSGWPCFHQEYLDRVRQHHDSLRRPDGTFKLPESELIQQLLNLPRLVCPQCKHGRHIYCGPCGGLRMENAVDLLPSRVLLPFNVHLVLHWAESLMKCTGIHAGVFCEPGTATYVDWKKDDAQWQAVVESWDPEVDVLLFPFANSTPADEFPWNHQASSGISTAGTSTTDETIYTGKRRRLLVLEASWQHAKAMSQRIIDHRKALGLPPIPSVILKDVTGEYWRFQTVGQSAVSTIEAIAHTARAAGSSQDVADNLLTLFKLQKYRVLKNTETKKTPRAVEVAGVGMGSWRQVCSIDENGHITPNNAYDKK